MSASDTNLRLGPGETIEIDTIAGKIKVMAEPYDQYPDAPHIVISWHDGELVSSGAEYCVIRRAVDADEAR